MNRSNCNVPIAMSWVIASTESERPLDCVIQTLEILGLKNDIIFLQYLLFTSVLHLRNIVSLLLWTGFGFFCGSLSVFLERSVQFSHWNNLDGSILHVFKCTAFSCYSASNNAVCCKSKSRSDVCLARVLFCSLKGFEVFRGPCFLSDFVQSLTCRVKGCSLSCSPDFPYP